MKEMELGERLQAGIPRPVLRFLSWPFGLAVCGRNKLFDRKILRTRSAGVPVISVGNITAGGTGKTPVAEFVARHCLKRGAKVAIISRGYKRESRGVLIVSDGRSIFVNAAGGGDEPVQIARRLPEACVVVGERRVDAARVAVERLGAEMIVLDDGFQHRYLHRDLDIVVIDARRFDDRDLLLPAGRRREPWSGIKRADVVAFTKVNGPSEMGHAAVSRLRRWYDGPTVLFRTTLERIRRAPDDTVVIHEQIRSTPLLAFSGIADHDGFVEDLGAVGFTVRCERRFPDHHTYSLGDVQSLIETLSHAGAEAFMTTEKDAMRLMADEQVVERFLRTHPVYYTCIAAEVVEGEGKFLSMVNACVDRRAHS